MDPATHSLVVGGKVGVQHGIAVARERLGPIALDGVESIQSSRHVLGRGEEISSSPMTPISRRPLSGVAQNLLRVCTPLNGENVVVVSSVDPMQIKGGKLSGEVRRGLPHLNLGPMRSRNESKLVDQSPARTRYGPGDPKGSLSIWGEFDVSHRLLEIKVMQHRRTLKVDNHSSSICHVLRLSASAPIPVKLGQAKAYLRLC